MKKKLGNERKDIVILSEQNIDYQVIIAVIDAAKSFQAVVAASVVNAVLFPDVSLGDAPDVEVKPWVQQKWNARRARLVVLKKMPLYHGVLLDDEPEWCGSYE